MNNSLRLIETLRAATSHLWAEKKIIAGLLAIVVPIDIALELLHPTFDDKNKETGWLVFMLSLQALVYTWFAVRVHRLIIGVANPIQGTFTWKSRETRFFAWLLASVVCLLSVWLLMGVIVLGAVKVAAPHDLNDDGVVWFPVLAFLPAAYLLARLIVLLPAIAIDRKQSVQWAWRLTRGYGWRLMLLLWGLPALLFLMLMILPLDVWLDSLLGTLVSNSVYGIITSIEIAALSIAFKVLGGLNAPYHGQTVPQQ